MIAPAQHVGEVTRKEWLLAQMLTHALACCARLRRCMYAITRMCQDVDNVDQEHMCIERASDPGVQFGPASLTELGPDAFSRYKVGVQ